MHSKSKQLANLLTDKLSDSRINEVRVVQEFEDAAVEAHTRFMKIIVSYIYTQAYKYEVGLIPADLAEVIYLCKKIKDYSLHDEFNPVVNPEYIETGREFLGGF